MTGRGGAEGYLFTAVRVVPAKGRVEARGKFARKRAADLGAEDIEGEVGKEKGVDAGEGGGKRMKVDEDGDGDGGAMNVDGDVGESKVGQSSKRDPVEIQQAMAAVGESSEVN